MERKRALVALVLVTAIACAPASTSGEGPASAAPAGALTTTPFRPTTAAAGPAFREALAASKVAEYKVSYRITDTNGHDSTPGEQTWFAKPPRARFDFSTDVGTQRTIVSLYALVDGTFVCYTGAAPAQCFGMSSLSTALQQNTAASVHESIMQGPEQFDGMLVETRQIAGQRAYCYDVRALKARVSGLTGGRFCYSTLGAPLLSQFQTQGGEVSMEATRLTPACRIRTSRCSRSPSRSGGPRCSSQCFLFEASSACTSSPRHGTAPGPRLADSESLECRHDLPSEPPVLITLVEGGDAQCDLLRTGLGQLADLSDDLLRRAVRHPHIQPGPRDVEAVVGGSEHSGCRDHGELRSSRLGWPEAAEARAGARRHPQG